MKVLKSRRYSSETDLESMIDLLLAVRPAGRTGDYPSASDLREALALPRVQGNTRLWFGAGDLVGFAYVDPYHNLRFEFAQQEAPLGIESQIVDWGVDCVRRAIQERGEPLTLDASCKADDSERIKLLERHGFVIGDMRTLRMARSLEQPIPVPQTPAGFHICHVAGEHEVEALVALHRAAFGTENMTVEGRLAMMSAPEYDPELDLLATAADGRLAATCVCSISLEENARTGRNEGYTDPISTHPDFQRRGLARELLLTGFQMLKERGVDTAVLSTSSQNLAMQCTAERVGFRVESTKLWFAKPVITGHNEG